jgi:8-oxo-dGTP diphosphatase
MTKPFIDVAAGLILRKDGSLLLAQRPGDKPWPGWWELPGGKIEAGESPLQALARELKEELGIDVTHATPWVTYTHEYPKTIVRLAFCRVTEWVGEPTGLEGQQLAWVDPAMPLAVGPLLPATEPPLRWLALPDRYLLTSIGRSENLARFLERLDAALDDGVRLVQFREPAMAPNAGADSNPGLCYSAFRAVLDRCRAAGARCLVNSAHPESWWNEADGVHLRAADAAARVPARAAEKLVGVSVHTAADLPLAHAAGADFVVLGHVLETPSHPDRPGMGWDRFAAIASQAALPVFAIGGQSADTMEEAKRHGAHGIAGIRRMVDTR